MWQLYVAALCGRSYVAAPIWQPNICNSPIYVVALMWQPAPSQLATEFRLDSLPRGDGRVAGRDMGHIVRHPSWSVQNQGPTKYITGFQIVHYGTSKT